MLKWERVCCREENIFYPEIFNSESSSKVSSSMRFKKIYSEKGYVLPFVLVVSLLVTSLLLQILVLLFFSHHQNQKLINKKKLDLACYSAIQKFLVNDQNLNEENQTFIIDSIQVSIDKKQKGIFWELTARASDSKDSSVIKDLLASIPGRFFENALVISKANLRAAVTGETKIIGDWLVSDNKITLSRINGILSAPNDYLDGRLIVQKDIDTKLFNEALVHKLFNNNDDLNRKTDVDNFTLTDSSIETAYGLREINVRGDLVINGIFSDKSKKEKELIFNVKGRTIIEDSTCSNIDLTIFSDSTISIKNFTNLENIILSAKGKITAGINSYFRNAQLFSQTGLKTDNSTFNYPSVLLLYMDLGNPKNFNSSINIKSSIVNGSVMLVSSITGLSSNKSKIKIDSGSRIQGLVYSENNVDVQGEIRGVLYTYGFWFYKDPTEYIDWLVNLRIDRNKLDKSFLLPVGFKGLENLEILKESWIY